MRKRRPKPPRAPRCMYSSGLHWFLGVLSPSLLFICSNTEEAARYFEDLKQYAIELEEWEAMRK